jgi:hypothetical protein
MTMVPLLIENLHWNGLIEWHRAAETAAVTSLWSCPREVTAGAGAALFDHGMLASQA